MRVVMLPLLVLAVACRGGKTSGSDSGEPTDPSGDIDLDGDGDGDGDGDTDDSDEDSGLESTCSCFDAAELDADLADWSQAGNIDPQLSCTADDDGESGATLEAYLTFEHSAGDGDPLSSYDRDMVGVSYVAEGDRYFCRNFIYSYTLNQETGEYSDYIDEDGFFETDLDDARACHSLVLAWTLAQGIPCEPAAR